MDWKTFQARYYAFPEIDFALDLSLARCDEAFVSEMAPAMHRAFAAMEELESGAIANPDEGRQVGHYWLRAPEMAPTQETREAIEHTLRRIEDLAAQVRSGELKGHNGPFHNLLCIGIGGSALGPQFVAQALGSPDRDPLDLFFFDNTDPDGFDRVLHQIEHELGQTLVVVTSKSGSTPETRNGMLEAQAAYRGAGLDFGRHAIAITGEGSKLDKVAESEGWLARFPMWDWVGGRTSELGPVGLVPAALSGYDIRAMLAGAREMDALTRKPDLNANPAALMALAWYRLTGGKGERDMVVLPYKDRLELFSRYLQQLVMESLGKREDLDGNVVEQGIAVYGNKGSTDQHAYVQQLRDGLPNFFAVFIEVLRDREGLSPLVDGSFTAGDYLHGFFLGTRKALADNDRPSLTLTIGSVSANSVGQLIALFERAVGFYASLVNINAYHQPGVEAGKKAAASTLELRGKLLARLREEPEKTFTAESLAQELGLENDIPAIFKILHHLSANTQNSVIRVPAERSTDDRFQSAKAD
ncbi:MAG: glucose-6-phosphate isomerase [Opitutales bacterium]